jgi:hypothetical protein
MRLYGKEWIRDCKEKEDARNSGLAEGLEIMREERNKRQK